MKVQSTFLILFFSAMMLSSCSAVETIFKAGMWWAFILIGLAVVLVLWIVMKAKK